MDPKKLMAECKPEFRKIIQASSLPDWRKDLILKFHGPNGGNGHD